jgi:hypothetical protein
MALRGGGRGGVKSQTLAWTNAMLESFLQHHGALSLIDDVPASSFAQQTLSDDELLEIGSTVLQLQLQETEDLRARAQRQSTDLNAQIEACLVQTTGIGEALVSNTTATKDLADDYSTSAKKSMWIQNRKGTILTVIIVAIIVSAVVILAIIIFVSTKPWLWIGRNNNNNNNNDDDDDDTRRRLLENLLPWR